MFVQGRAVEPGQVPVPPPERVTAPEAAGQVRGSHPPVARPGREKPSEYMTWMSRDTRLVALVRRDALS